MPKRPTDRPRHANDDVTVKYASPTLCLTLARPLTQCWLSSAMPDAFNEDGLSERPRQIKFSQFPLIMKQISIATWPVQTGEKKRVVCFAKQEPGRAGQKLIRGITVALPAHMLVDI